MYAISSIGKWASVSYDSFEEALKVLNALRDAGGLEKKNYVSMTRQEKLDDLSNQFSFPYIDRDVIRVSCDRTRVLFARDQSHCYTVTVRGNTVEGVERAKSYIDNLS